MPLAARVYAVRVDVDPQKLAAPAKSVSTRSRSAIGTPNVNLPTGNHLRRHNLRGADQRPIDEGGHLRPGLIVAYRNGNPVRLDEVAHVYDGVENDKNGGLYRKRAALDFFDVPEAPGTNVVAVVDASRGTSRRSPPCSPPP